MHTFGVQSRSKGALGGTLSKGPVGFYSLLQRLPSYRGGRNGLRLWMPIQNPWTWKPIRPYWRCRGSFEGDLRPSDPLKTVKAMCWTPIYYTIPCRLPYDTIPQYTALHYTRPSNKVFWAHTAADDINPHDLIYRNPRNSGGVVNSW